MKTNKPPGYKAPAVLKAFELLKLVAESRSEITLSELARQLGYSKGTLHGMIRALLQAGALAKAPNRKGFFLLPYDDAKKPMSVYYGFNVEKPPFNNVLVRQAFAAAVDREQIAQKALGYNFRNAAPATSLTPPEILARDLYNEVGIPFDPSRAKELLQQAGYSSVESFPSTTLLVSTRGKGAPGAYYQMAKIIVGMWQTNLGIKVEIEVVNIQDYGNRFSTNPPDIYQLGWVADYKDPDNFLKALFLKQ